MNKETFNTVRDMAFIVGTQSQDEFFMGRMLAMWLPLYLLISPSVYFTLLGAPQFRIFASVRAHKWQQGVLAPEEHCSSTKLSYCQMQSTPNLSRTSTKTAHRAQSSPKYEHNVRLRAEQIRGRHLTTLTLTMTGEAQKASITAQNKAKSHEIID